MAKAKPERYEELRRMSKRGTVNNKNRLANFTKARTGKQADWGGCDAAKLQGVVVAITDLGGAITIGLSRDKGAHSMTLLLDETRETMWFNRDADLDAELDDIIGLLEAEKE